MSSWVCVIGSNPMATVNCFWSAARQCNLKNLQEIYLLSATEFDTNWQIVEKWLKEICIVNKIIHVTINKHEFLDCDIITFKKALQKILKLAQAPISLDMTSGRKPHAAWLMEACDENREKIVHLYYNYIEDSDFSDYPLPLLPAYTYHFIDMKGIENE